VCPGLNLRANRDHNSSDVTKNCNESLLYPHPYMQRLCQLLVQYWLHWISSVVLSLHCGHIESSCTCIMLVYFGFNKLCQKSYSDSQDLPGISRHLSLLPVESHLFDLKQDWGPLPSVCGCNPIYPDPFQRRSSCGPGWPRSSNRDTLVLYSGNIHCVI